MTPQAETAKAIWAAGVAAVGGYASTKSALTKNPLATPDQIIAVGKAASTMMRAALDHFGSVPALVVTKDGHADGLPDHVHLIESAHPVPDARSIAAGRALRDTVTGMAQGSTLLLLVSGGASSLAEDPAEGHDLNDLITLNQTLLASGLDITAMNIERRKLSRIKGGGLLAHFVGAHAHVLAISDVPGDDIAVIGSGIGCAPDQPTFQVTSRIIASNAHARTAAAQAARDRGLTVLIDDERLHNDLGALTTEVGALIRNMKPGAVILGGEPTVVLPPNPGQGGRNQALGLALAGEIRGLHDITIVVGGTDGSDGPTEAAGAIVDGGTWQPGAADALAMADSGSFLGQRGALLTTGPTGTNVMDLLVALRS